MSHFKSNERVVFKYKPPFNPYSILPKDGEIVTIEKQNEFYSDFYHIKEYPFSQNEQLQSFKYIVLKKLQYENISNEIVSKLKTIDERCDVEIKQIETIETIKQ